MAKQYSRVNDMSETSDLSSFDQGAAALNNDTSYKGFQNSPGSFSATVSANESEESPNESPQAAKKAWTLISSTISSEKRAAVVSTVDDNASKHCSWIPEILNLGLAVGALVGVIVILAHFNEQALPNWPYNITINTLVALLATILNATVAVCLQSGLSQLKWITFRSDRAPLVNFESFDEASRGSWGAFKLLALARGGIFGSFGAIIAILTLVLGPFAQQAVGYRTRTIAHPNLAKIPRALNYTGALPGNSSSTGYVPILPMKSAVYNGLFAENGKPAANLPFTCPSGNCTWPMYDTLAVCSECFDISSFMERYCGPNNTEHDRQNFDFCGWKVPQGAVLNTSLDVFSMTPFFPSPHGNMPYATIMKLIFMGTESQNIANVLNPWALQCSLTFCVQNLSSSVISGSLLENVTNTIRNTTVVDITSFQLDGNASSADTSDQYAVYISSSHSIPYQVSMGAKLALTGWFSTLFRVGSATRNSSSFNRSISSTDADAIAVNLTVGISSGDTFFDTDIVTAFYWNYYQYSQGIPLLLSDLATSMTVAFRSFTGAVVVSGAAETTESYVCVRWSFLTPPLVVVVGAGLFLGCVMWRTKVTGCQQWKGSVLAVLRCGLDSKIRKSFEETEDLNRMRSVAKGVKVKLNADDEGIWLRE